MANREPELIATSIVNDRQNEFETRQRTAAGGGALLRWTHGLFNRIVMTGDVVLICGSGLLPFALRDVSPAPLTGSQAMVLAILQAAVFATVLRRTNAYRVENHARFWRPVGPLALGLLVAWVVSLLFLRAFRPATPGALQVLGAIFFLQTVLLMLARQGARLLLQTVRRQSLLRRNVVLIGTNPVAEALLARMLSPAERTNYRIVGLFADAADERRCGTLLGETIQEDLDLLGASAQANAVDLVIVALPMHRAAQTVAMIEHLKWMAADVVIPIGDMGMRPGLARLTRIAGTSTLQVLHRPLRGSEALLKIVEDYIVAVAALAMAAPLMLLVALAIRLESDGPVFFRQDRTGFSNNNFRIYKFRTMTVDPADDGSVGTRNRNDPRFTRIGGMLRRLSIDELPQLFNVLCGEMSIVGPRPYVPNMLVGNDTFRRAVRNFAYRHRLKPGITGLAQVNGMRSHALRSLANAQRSIDLDLFYIAHWSLWLDIKIMFRTVFVAMTGHEVF